MIGKVAKHTLAVDVEASVDEKLEANSARIEKAACAEGVLAQNPVVKSISGVVVDEDGRKLRAELTAQHRVTRDGKPMNHVRAGEFTHRQTGGEAGSGIDPNGVRRQMGGNAGALLANPDKTISAAIRHQSKG